MNFRLTSSENLVGLMGHNMCEYLNHDEQVIVDERTLYLEFEHACVICCRDYVMITSGSSNIYFTIKCVFSPLF